MHVPSLLLSFIPREPDRIDTTRLRLALAAQGIDRTPRAIQQQLTSLSSDHPIRCIATSKPYQWQWRREARGYEFPPMNAHTALTLTLAFEYLSPLLPQATLQHLRSQVTRAKEVLGQSGSVAKWKNKVRVLPRGIQLLAPKIAPEVLHTVYDGVLQERCLLVCYKKRNAKSAEEFEVHPLAIVARGSLITMVCTKKGELRQLHLHRIQSISLLDERVRVPASFDLDRFIGEGNLAFRKGGQEIFLRALFDTAAVTTLEETPLARTQTLGEEREGRRLLEATVPDTVDLRAWLASYGPMVEVLEPRALRDEFAANAKKLARLYK